MGFIQRAARLFILLCQGVGILSRGGDVWEYLLKSVVSSYCLADPLVDQNEAVSVESECIGRRKKDEEYWIYFPLQLKLSVS